MAFQVKYRCEFKDLNGIDWKVEIEQDPWAGAVTALKASDDPLRFEWNAESDDVVDPIKTSDAILTVWSETSFALTDLYSEQDLKFRVKIYEATVLYWTGFIITDNYSEPYIDVPYPVTITASCGLEQLKNVLYDNAGTYYDGRTFESQIIIDILGKIGYTGFTEYINIYEETMAVTAGSSPLDQIKIDVDIFQDMYCYEVLKELLKKYNACIVHKAGGFVLYRPTELVGATVYGRIFTAVSTKSATTFTPVKYIDRTTASTLRQIPGGVMMIQRPAKKVTLFQDFGYKQSWINNWQFTSNTFGGTFIAGYTITGWTQSVDDIITPLNDIGEKDGCFIVVQNAYPTLTNYIYQTFGTYALLSSNVFSIEFDYLLYNFSGTARTGEAFYIRVKCEDTGHYLYGVNDDYCQWDTSLNTIILTNDAPVGSSGWFSFKRKFTGLPSNNTYTITFYGLNNAYPKIYPAVKNVRFYSTSDVIISQLYLARPLPDVLPKWRDTLPIQFARLKTRLKTIENTETVQKEISGVNAINGKDYSNDVMLGDVQFADCGINNILEQFAGSLAVSSVIGYTGSTSKVDTITVNAGGSGTGTVTINSISAIITWNTNASTTIDDFLTSYGLYFPSIALAKASSSTFTATAAFNFTNATISASFGSAVVTVAFVAGTPVTGLGPTIDWNSYDGTHTSRAESNPLLTVIKNELLAQYARPKQLIQMAIYDEGAAVSAVNILGNYQDELNQVGAVNRKFVFNRGEFGVKFRNWMIDLMEII